MERLLIGSLLAVILVSCTQESDSQKAEPNPNGVPNVIGLSLSDACQRMSQEHYVGTLGKVVQAEGSAGGVVVRQSVIPGKRRFMGNLVYFKVAEPFDGALPEMCADRRGNYLIDQEGDFPS
jgi:hypothetical protein